MQLPLNLKGNEVKVVSSVRKLVDSGNPSLIHPRVWSDAKMHESPNETQDRDEYDYNCRDFE